MSQSLSRPIRIIGNTLIDYKTYTADGALEMNVINPVDPFPTFTGAKIIRDNVRHAPNRSVPITALGASPTVVQALECYTIKARIDLADNGIHTDFTTTTTGENLIAPGGVVNLLRPVTGATVIGAATGPMGRLDLLGAVRPANASSGAVEPA